MTAPVRTDWRAVVSPYIGADVARSLLQLVSTLVLLAGAFAATYWAASHALWLWIVLVPVLAGLLIRSFIIMHDCAHGSFLPWRRANDAIGCVTGLLAMTPFDQWRRDHAIHHASSGDLDRRGHGDVTTLTVREYLAKTPRQRLGYRLSRHPFWLLAGGPIYLLYSQRIRPKSKATRSRQVESVLWTNAALFGLAAIVVLAWGWLGLLVWFVGYYFAAVSGVWLFYVQHQFEDAYWEAHSDWDYETAAIRGSSHLRLPPILQWFTGNIGLHHVHHLAPRIPNYRLQRCHDENPVLQAAPVITIRSGIAALRLSLWDEDRRRLIGFAQLREQGMGHRAQGDEGHPA
jgi:omega-6 fatty acid desaturase (delta-12 desaturase)